MMANQRRINIDGGKKRAHSSKNSRSIQLLLAALVELNTSFGTMESQTGNDLSDRIANEFAGKLVKGYIRWLIAPAMLLMKSYWWGTVMAGV